MILIDRREDEQLTRELARFHLPFACVELPWGDCSFAGKGPDGPLLIGFERKRLPDLIHSMQDRRLAGSQLVGMRQLYARVGLVVEGLWRPGQEGTIEVQDGHGEWVEYYHRKKQGIAWRQIDSFLQSLVELCGVEVWRTATVRETAHLYCSRYRWWQKDYALHRSHRQIHALDPLAARGGRVEFGREPNAIVRVAAQIPGIDRKAWSIGEQFGSVWEMTDASIERWESVWWDDGKGKRKQFSRESARKIVAWLRGLEVA
ncbi:MAG TPA: ERCC4 domain-containing protein [Rugosimonospora sp.]|nr:ERCC4 domain-containing protein [Rugosimonospora sp.]